MGRKSREARSGCIRANKASKFDSSCALGVALVPNLGPGFEIVGVKLNREFRDFVPFAGDSSTIVSSSFISRLFVESASTSVTTVLCRFSSISNISRLRLSISNPTSPSTAFHSSSHSIASSTCSFTPLSNDRTLPQFFSVNSICTTTLFN